MHELWWQRAEWLFFLPGDVLVGLVGPAAAAGIPLALISIAAWLLLVLVSLYLLGMMQDAVDPTWRQQRREGRRAKKQAKRAAHLRGRTPATRIEPTLRSTSASDAAR
jgi:hypothetical protein